MNGLAKEYLDRAKGNQDYAMRRFAHDLMRGDEATHKAGYTRENAVIATAESFGVEREDVDVLLPRDVPKLSEALKATGLPTPFAMALSTWLVDQERQLRAPDTRLDTDKLITVLTVAARDVESFAYAREHGITAGEAYKTLYGEEAYDKLYGQALRREAAR
jgi:hypothetical protein